MCRLFRDARTGKKEHGMIDGCCAVCICNDHACSTAGSCRQIPPKGATRSSFREVSLSVVNLITCCCSFWHHLLACTLCTCPTVLCSFLFILTAPPLLARVLLVCGATEKGTERMKSGTLVIAAVAALVAAPAAAFVPSITVRHAVSSAR